MRPTCAIWRFATLTALMVAAGCGRSGLYPVKGKVVFPDGTPLTAGTVEFDPLDKKSILAPRGEIRADGTFRASTHEDGDGAPPGQYRVMVTPPEQVDPDQPRPKPFDRRFQSFQTSGLEYTVKAGTNEFFTITVEPRPPRAAR
jgi:hypothetical protein